MPESDTRIGLDILDYVLMVVVGRRAVDVELHESLALQSGKQLVNPVEQPELPHVGILRHPVGDNMEVDNRLCTVFDSRHNGLPFEGNKFYEYGRTLPCRLLLDKLHVVVP